ncbi:hypothetical protein AB0I28_20595 [Phytomonospora sp. NPDC050363]|uniref:hypothetical protein n=1 Tax=Phytomonospora sp. NPDC050363 TaxID=3155642 RepID=UPI0033D7AA31
MTRDFGSSLDRELDTASPPTAITADGLVRKGRLETRRRSLTAGAASVVIVALAAGLVFQLAGRAGGDRADPAASPSTSSSESAAPSFPLTQSAFPLPQPDPDKKWFWATVGSVEQNPATRALTGAWYQALSNIDGAELFTSDMDTGVTSAATSANFGPFTRRVDGLAENVATEPGAFGRGELQGYQRPMYELWNVNLHFDGVKRPDGIRIEYFPKGSYIEGVKSIPGAVPGASDWRYLSSGCEDYFWSGQGRDGWKADYTCRESTGPNGERVQEILLDTHRPNDSSPPSRSSKVIVYLPDGNAVVVEDIAPEPMEPGEPSIPDAEPGLTPRELAELVFSIPAVVIV